MKMNIKRIATLASAAVLAFVFFSNFGFIKSIGSSVAYERPSEKKAVAKMVYPLNSEITGAMDKANNAAHAYVAGELDKWIDELMVRVDSDFLDNYFSFMQIKRREMLSVFNSVRHFFNRNAESAEDAAIRELEENLRKYVIKPELSQAKIDNITNQAIVLYMETFDNELARLQESYKIPTPDWNRYIADLCGLTIDVNQKAYPIKFKIAVASGAALSGIALAPVIKKVIAKVSSKIVAKAGAKTAGKFAAKTGTKIAGKGAGTAAKAIPFIGLGVTAAICVWDIVDYAKTSSEGKRLLRQSLNDYFHEVKNEMLAGNENSIMGSLTAWENSFKEKIARHN